MKKQIPDIGQPAPDFQVLNSEEKQFHLQQVLSETRSLLLVFYRGHW